MALGFTPMLLIVAAGLTSFLYIRDVTEDDAPSFVGAVAYSFSVFSLHRAAQVDNAELTLVLLPVGLLCLRHADRDKIAKCFVGLALVMTALAFWGFLQEVAYTFLFFGAYALYRSAGAKDDRRRWLDPIVVMALASTVALIFSAPRLITIKNEFGALARTTALNYYGFDQILRFFHEGIYGRYFREGTSLGNGMNLSEGLQLVSSCALSLFVCFGIARPRSYAEAIGAVLFYGLLLAIIPAFGHGLFQRIFGHFFQVSDELYRFLFFSALLLIGVQIAMPRGKLSPAILTSRFVPPLPRPTDTTFHLFALAGVLFLVLISEGYALVYYLFDRADFTHTRLSLLAVLPMCTLFSVYLAELKTLSVFGDNRQARGGFLVPLSTAVLSGGLAYAIYGPFFDKLIPRDIVRLTLLSTNRLMPTVAAQVLLTAVLLSSFLILMIRKRSAHRAAGIVGVAIGTFVMVEVLLYAHLKIAGPQTWTYPIAFQGFSYFNAPPAVLRPPDEIELVAFARLFETQKYRMIALSDNTQYLGTNIPHIAQFWRARSIGGYGTGVAERLAKLPWPEGIQTLRTIDFTSTHGLNNSVFALLAFLNVKYLISLTPNVYFNLTTAPKVANSDVRSLSIGGTNYPLQSRDARGVVFDFLENPVEALPRHFLVNRVVDSAHAPPILAHPYWDAGTGEQLGFLHVFSGQTDDLRQKSYAEGLRSGVTNFNSSGRLDVSYLGDRIEVNVTPSGRERFLVINQTYNRNWKAYVGTATLPVLPTNLVMTGVPIPPTTGRVELRFEPFSSSHSAAALTLAGVGIFVGGIFAMRRWQGGRQDAK